MAKFEEGDEGAFDKMVKDIRLYDTKKLLVVARAFTHFLALSNSAENHHRLRRLRQRMMDHDGALSPKNSCDGTVHRLVSERMKTPEEVFEISANKCRDSPCATYGS